MWLHVLLLVLTIASTTYAGISHYLAFQSDFLPERSIGLTAGLALRGFWYSGTILAILGCHELGHYFACRYYDVDASRPFFLPFPLAITGTLGAFIRIREPIPAKHMLFDIGIAGPIAGFLVAVPALAHRGFDVPRREAAAELRRLRAGRAAALQSHLMARLGHGAGRLLGQHAPDGVRRVVWPAGDGPQPVPGRTTRRRPHLYAVLGRRSTYVTYVMLVVAVGLASLYTSWIVWTVLMIVMLFMFGPRHPRVFDEHVPLDRTRLLLALFALFMFIVCFTPAPIQPMDLIKR